MPTIVTQLTGLFAAAIKQAFGVEVDPLVAASQQQEFGDYQSNVAMSLAKTVGQKPRAVAEQIKAKLDQEPAIKAIADEITIAGPGFINVKLSHAWLSQELQKLLGDKRLGVDSVAPSQRQTVVVDYSGPNVAKEMHVGHLRSTIIGDAISRVLEFQGHEIIRQNHIGDWGTQFGMLIEHLVDVIGIKTVWTASFEIGDLNVFYQQAKSKFDADPDFADRSRKRVVTLQSGDADTYESWRMLTVKSLEHFDDVYDRLGVLLDDHDIRGESSYNPDLPSVVTELKQLGLAVESDGATAVFIDGHEKPPVLVEKTGGGYLYATTDLAAIRHRVKELHAQRVIYVHDSRQANHFRQLFAVVKEAGWAKGVSLEFAPFGTMLGEDGKPFKTRTGGTVKLKELLDEAEERALAVVTAKNPNLSGDDKQNIAHAVGIGAVKYSDLAKDRIADYVFSFDKMLAMDGNTAPYLQYAHARIRSIFRKADPHPNPLPDYRARGSDGEVVLESPFELALGKHILRLGETVEAVARDLKPHLLCTYLYDLATKFSGFYENCPVIQSAEPARSSRLRLCDLTARTLEIGLDLLGIQHPDQM